jgi:hypothetical protein
MEDANSAINVLDRMKNTMNLVTDQFGNLLRTLGVVDEEKISLLQGQLMYQDKQRYLDICEDVLSGAQFFTKKDEKLVRTLDREHTIDCVSILALKHRILHGSDSWIDCFVSCGGVAVLVETIDNCLEAQPVNSNALFEVIQCFYRVLEVVQLDEITKTRGAVHACVMALNFEHGALAAVVLELLNAICLVGSAVSIVQEVTAALQQISMNNSEGETGNPTYSFLVTGAGSSDLNIRFNALRFINSLLMKKNLADRLQFRKLLCRAGISAAVGRHRGIPAAGIDHNAAVSPTAAFDTISADACYFQCICHIFPECEGYDQPWFEEFVGMQDLMNYQVTLTSDVLLLRVEVEEDSDVETVDGGNGVKFAAKAFEVPVSAIKNIAAFCTNDEVQAEAEYLFRAELIDGTVLNFVFETDDDQGALGSAFDNAIARKKAQLSVWSKIETKKYCAVQDWNTQVELFDRLVEDEAALIQKQLEGGGFLQGGHAILDFAICRTEEMGPQYGHQSVMMKCIQTCIYDIGTVGITQKPLSLSSGHTTLESGEHAAVSSGPDTAGLSAELIEKLPKLEILLRMRGEDTVRQKMCLDGFSNDFVEKFILSKSGKKAAFVTAAAEPSLQVSPVTATSTSLDLSGLTEALKSRLPAMEMLLKASKNPEAVHKKMTAENFPSAFIEQFLASKLSPSSHASEASAEVQPAIPVPVSTSLDTSCLQKAQIERLGAMEKLFKMSKSKDIVRMKMTNELFPADFIELFLTVHSGNSSLQSSAELPVPSAGNASSDKFSSGPVTVQPPKSTVNTFNLPSRLEHGGAGTRLAVQFRAPVLEAVNRSRLWKNMSEVAVNFDEVGSAFAVNEADCRSAAVAGLGPGSAAEDTQQTSGISRSGAGPVKMSNIADQILGAKLKGKSNATYVFRESMDPRYELIASKLPALRPFEQVRNQLVQLNSEQLSKASSLELNRIVPNSEEIRMMDKATPAVRAADEFCQFFDAIITVPRYEERLRLHLRVFALQEQVPTLITTFEDSIKDITTAVGLINNSTGDIMCYLGYALSFCNYLNAGRANAGAYGISIEELLRLQTIRATDIPTGRASYSVLHAVDDMMRKSNAPFFFKNSAWDAGILTLAMGATENVRLYSYPDGIIIAEF